MLLVAERNRENTGGFGARSDRRLADLPILASVLGMKESRLLGPARREPDVPFAVGDEARAAGGEGPLPRQGGRKNLRRQRLPIGPAVCGNNQLKHPLY